MDAQKIKKGIERIVIPYYTELTFYTMSVTVLLLVFANLHIETVNFTVHPHAGRSKNQLIYFIALFVLGMVLPIVHVFIRRKKSELDKFLIQSFSVIINIIVCLYSCGYIYNAKKDWFYVLPAWNFVYAFIMPMAIRYDVLNVDQAFDKEASFKETLISSTVLVIVFYLCQYVYDLYWGITFSICVICSTNINRLVNGNEVEINGA